VSQLGQCYNPSDMGTKRVKTVYIVGAGFSSYAGLPLTTGFTKAILDARRFDEGPSRLIVDFVSKFIRESFDHSTTGKPEHWPDLEDIFTCVDLSANSGHHLGAAFTPADLRTVRRAILSRIIRMLDHKYRTGRRHKTSDWRTLDNFFDQIDLQNSGFISLNWDNVLERKLQPLLGGPLIDYGCDAAAVAIPDLANRDDFDSRKAYLKELRKPQSVALAKSLMDDETLRCVPLIKIHGSINWLYCDNCRRLFWFHPDQVTRIADQLITADDLERMSRIIGKIGLATQQTIDRLNKKPRIVCLCSQQVSLGARIATFSYRKALEFPMFQKSWFAAEELLRDADEWIFIGYSLPGADFEFKYLLKRMELCRNKHPRITVVSGGDSRSAARTRKNYYRFFGRAITDSTFIKGGLAAYLR
jgi:hypothetical protein